MFKKEQKIETLDFLYFKDDKKENNQNKKHLPSKKKKEKNKSKEKANINNEEINKSKPFRIDEEIVIGLRPLDNPKEQKQPDSKKKAKIKKRKKKGAAKKAAPKENIPEKLTKKQQIMLKKRKRIIKIAKWTSLIGVIITAIIVTIMSPMFDIVKVSVIGNEKIASEEIINSSNIIMGENIFKINRKSIIDGIKKDPYIESVEINLNLPDSIVLEIKERKPTFMIMIYNKYIYLNSQGYFLEVSTEPLDLIIIEGFETKEEDILPGLRLCNEDLKTLQDVIDISEAANFSEIDGKINRIDARNSYDYKLIFEEEKKVAYLGEASNLTNKMVFLKAIIENEKGKEGEIYLNVDLNKKPAFFREKV